MSEKITLGISSVWERREGAFALAEVTKELFFEIVIVIQRAPSESCTRNGNSILIQTSDVGLSKSRNLLIHHATSRWLWIADDDVKIDEACYALVNTYILRNSGFYQMLAGRIGCTNSDEYFKNYKYRWCKPLLFAQLSSVEMIIDREWCISKNIKFDHNFGLGTVRPVAEEPIFASDVVKNGGKILDIPSVTVYHPCNSVTKSAHASWSNSKIAYIRGEAARRIGGVRGFLVLVSFLAFSLKRYSVKSFLQLICGYIAVRS